MGIKQTKIVLFSLTLQLNTVPLFQDDDQTLVGDASSVGELPDDCCSISSPPAFQRKMIPGNVDGYRTRSRSPYLKETRSRFAYDKVYHTPYTEHSYQVGNRHLGKS